MRRTQLYIDDKTYQELAARARLNRTTISEIVRGMLRSVLDNDIEQRRKALLGAVGLWSDRTDLPETENYVRSLRQSPRRWKKLKR